MRSFIKSVHSNISLRLSIKIWKISRRSCQNVGKMARQLQVKSAHHIISRERYIWHPKAYRKKKHKVLISADINANITNLFFPSFQLDHYIGMCIKYKAKSPSLSEWQKQRKKVRQLRRQSGNNFPENNEENLSNGSLKRRFQNWAVEKAKSRRKEGTKEDVLREKCRKAYTRETWVTAKELWQNEDTVKTRKESVKELTKQKWKKNSEKKKLKEERKRQLAKEGACRYCQRVKADFLWNIWRRCWAENGNTRHIKLSFHQQNG